MRSVVLVKNGSAANAFEIQELPSPAVPEGCVKIKVEGFGLNYADVMARNGLYREAPKLPFTPGYEAVGHIIEGPEDMIGQRVLAFTRFGGYSEEVVTLAEAVTPIKEDTPLGEALALGTQYVTAYHAAYEQVNLFEGDKVLIHAAAGGVGIALTQLAKLKGCEVFGTASKSDKLEYIGKNGVDHPINYKTSDYEVEITKILGKERLDVAFNSVGGSTFKKDRKLVGTAGKQVLYGGAERSGKKFGIFSTLSFVNKMGLVIPIGLMMRSKGIVGVNMLKVADYKPHIMQRCMKCVVNLYKEGKIKPYVGGEFKAEQIAEAHQLLEGRDSMGKIAVKW